MQTAQEVGFGHAGTDRAWERARDYAFEIMHLSKYRKSCNAPLPPVQAHAGAFDCNWAKPVPRGWGH